MLFITVYVDDLLVFSNEPEWKRELKDCLMSNFKMKDIGEARFVLGMQITRDRKNAKLWVDQKLYVTDVLSRFGLTDCNAVATPADTNQKLSSAMCPSNDAERKKMESVPYQEAVGSLLYASQISRPDISYAVNMVSRYCQNPGPAHWLAVKRILRYLKGTIGARLEKKGLEKTTKECKVFVMLIGAMKMTQDDQHQDMCTVSKMLQFHGM